MISKSQLVIFSALLASQGLVEGALSTLLTSEGLVGVGGTLGEFPYVKKRNSVITTAAVADAVIQNAKNMMENPEARPADPDQALIHDQLQKLKEAHIELISEQAAKAAEDAEQADSDYKTIASNHQYKVAMSASKTLKKLIASAEVLKKKADEKSVQLKAAQEELERLLTEKTAADEAASNAVTQKVASSAANPPAVASAEAEAAKAKVVECEAALNLSRAKVARAESEFQLALEVYAVAVEEIESAKEEAQKAWFSYTRSRPSVRPGSKTEKWLKAIGKKAAEDAAKKAAEDAAKKAAEDAAKKAAEAEAAKKAAEDAAKKVAEAPGSNKVETPVPSSDPTPVVNPAAQPESKPVSAPAESAVPEFKALEKKAVDELTAGLVKTVLGDKPAKEEAENMTKIVKAAFILNNRAENLQTELKKLAPKPAEGKAENQTRRLAEKAETSKKEDPLVNVIRDTATEALNSLTQLQTRHGAKYEKVIDQATYNVFKTDVAETEGVFARAEAVIKLRDDNNSKAAELKSAKATVLGLGLGLGLGIPVLVGVVFTVLVKTNRVLLNFGSTVSADV